MADSWRDSISRGLKLWMHHPKEFPVIATPTAAEALGKVAVRLTADEARALWTWLTVLELDPDSDALGSATDALADAMERAGLTTEL